ncbi:oligosaccharide flippase family protein [Halorubrum sp. CBA1125]|uniref:oligosaccharide flippase family protein n=1 Tax=Halorubrum sp. CBA1125 TaxID=2668072 RepID=UPI0012E82215|nr:oligosaccharide flippase family protein [Halorubrum sp. CBA1125]MUW13421.1 oligosaccharide flippase family protein [Halorubrum sp. CBA1125]
MTDQNPSEENPHTDNSSTDDSEFSQDDAVRGILKGAGVVYAGLILNMGIAFVAQRFAAVHLSIGGFGSLLSGTALLDVGAVVAGLGLSSGLIRYLPRVDEGQKRPLVKYAFLFTLPFSLVVAIPTVAFADVIASQVFGDPEIAISLRIFGATIPFAAILNLAIGGIRGQMVSRFRVYIKDILHPSIRFGLIMVAVVVGAGQAGFAAGYAIPYIVGAVVAVVLLWKVLPRGKGMEAGKSVLPEMVRYSLPFTVSGLASFIYRSIDIFLILYLLDSRAVGMYGVAYAFARLIAMFSTAFTYLSTPVSSQLEDDDRVNEAVAVQGTIARWIIIATTAALVPMSVFASEFLGLIYRPAYATGGTVLVILVAGFAIKNVLQTHGPILEALGKSKLAAFNTSTAAVVNVVTNLALIPRFGIEGAAVATSISFIVLGGLPMVEVWYYTSLTSLSRTVFAPAFLAVPISIAAIPVFRATPPTLLWVLATSAAFVLFYAVAVIAVLGFTRADVMVIRSVEDKYGVPLGPFDAVLRRFS